MIMKTTQIFEMFAIDANKDNIPFQSDGNFSGTRTLIYPYSNRIEKVKEK